jgi:hypothetical protein
MRKSMHSAIRLRPPAATAGGGSVKPASALAIGMAAAPSTDCRARRACPPGLFGRGLMRSSSLGVPKGHRGPGAALAGRRGGEAIRTVPGPSLADLSSCVGVALLASYSVRPGARAASGNVRRCESGKACGGRFRFPSRGRVAWAWWLSAIRLNNSVEPFGAIEELHSLWKSWRVRLSLRRSWSLTFCRPTPCPAPPSCRASTAAQRRPSRSFNISPKTRFLLDRLLGTGIHVCILNRLGQCSRVICGQSSKKRSAQPVSTPARPAAHQPPEGAERSACPSPQRCPLRIVRRAR